MAIDENMRNMQDIIHDGYIVKLRNGDLYLTINGNLVPCPKNRHLNLRLCLDDYTDVLTCYVNRFLPDFDIMAVYGKFKSINQNDYFDTSKRDLIYIRSDKDISNKKIDNKNKDDSNHKNIKILGDISLNDFAKDIYINSAKHGFDTLNISDSMSANFAVKIALMHSELSEALEEIRDKKPSIYYYKNNEHSKENIIAKNDFAEYNGEKLEGFIIELIDCMIRILDLLAFYDAHIEYIDIEQLLILKYQYNKTRPYKHGDKLF